MKLKLFKINIFVISLFLFGLLIIPQVSNAGSVGWYSPKPATLDGAYLVSPPFGPYISKAACVANLPETEPETSCKHVTAGPRWYFFLVRPNHDVTIESRPTESACLQAINAYNNNHSSDFNSQIPTDRGLPCFLVSADVVPPSLVMMSPTAGGTYTVGTPVTLSAAVIDWGEIEKVRFHKSTQQIMLGEDTNIADSTFSFQWTPTTADIGPLVIKAQAYDIAGNFSDITAPNSIRNITITAQGQQVDSTPPVVTFVSPTPAENSTVVINQPVTIKVTAVDNVANVKFYVGETLLGTDTTSPYENSSWTPDATGTFIIKAIAVDTSSPAHITTQTRNIIVGIVPSGNGNDNTLLTISDGPTYDFGVQAIGSSTSHTFTLTNIATTDFTGLGASGLIAPFTFLGGSYPGTGGTCTTSLAIGANCTIVVNYSPTTAGVNTASFNVLYNNGTAQTSSITLTGADTVVQEEEEEEEQETDPVIIDEPSGLIPCGNLRYGEGETQEIDGQTVDVSYQVSNPCDFNGVLHLINNVVHFILFFLAVPIAAIMFAYAGFILLTSGGSTEKKSKAKNIFLNVAIGLIFAAASWLIISTVLSILGYDGSWIGF